MISKTKSSLILNALMGVNNSFTAPSNVYLGLCAREPDATTGALTDAGEPTSVASYSRKQVGGTSTSAVKFFGASSNSGIIKNSMEVQLKTAREDYPEKIGYWFLSESSTGAAYLWGRIKDVLSETKTVEGFLAENTYNTYTASVVCDELLGLKVGTTYVVTWDGVEYDEVAELYEKDGVSYIRLGNPLISGGENDEEKPFGILYNESTTGTETVGTMTLYSVTGEGTHTVAIYGIGIEVKKATVPTFYENELQASIDVALS